MPISRVVRANIRCQVDLLRVAPLRQDLQQGANLFGATGLYLHRPYKYVP